MFEACSLEDHEIGLRNTEILWKYIEDILSIFLFVVVNFSKNFLYF